MRIMLSKALVFAVIVLFIGAGFVPSISSDNSSFGNTIHVDDDADPSWYDATHVKTIQEGVDNASSGDTVYVYNGTYYENVVVNKTIDLIGEDRNNTIIDGNSSGKVIIISSSNVDLEGFTIQNSGSNWYDAGIYLISNFHDLSSVNIQNNNFVSNECGVVVSEFGLYNISDCFIINNNFSNNVNGIYLISENFNVSNITISSNVFYQNEYGILIYDYCYQNTIINNIFYSGSLSFIYDSKYNFNNLVQGNYVNGKPLLYLENISDEVYNTSFGQIILLNCENISIMNQEISDTSLAIELLFSNNCHVIDNILQSNNYGVLLHHSNQNIITGSNISWNDENSIELLYSSNNTFSNNNFYLNGGDGIRLSYNSNNNSFTSNEFIENYYGIYSKWCESNLIYHNTFENNHVNARTYLSNDIWFKNSSVGGNHWDDYTGTDADGDGIGDIPYDIPGGSNQDNYPLMYPFEYYDNGAVYIDDDYDNSTTGWNVTRFNIIQDGIDAVLENGTVYVYNGEYHENLVVNKTIDLIGEDKNHTILHVDTVDFYYGIQITTPHVKIDNISITSQQKNNNARNQATIEELLSDINERAGPIEFIRIEEGGDFTEVTHCTIFDIYGILNVGSSYNHFSNCTFENTYELLFSEGTMNVIEDCIFYNNLYGVLFAESHNNILRNNNFGKSGVLLVGFELSEHIHTISNNYIDTKPIIYLTNQTDTTYNKTEVGEFILVNCSNINIEQCNLSNSSCGVELALCSSVSIDTCQLTDNFFAILSFFTDNTSIIRSSILNNYYGIYYYTENDNSNISNNDFISNEWIACVAEESDSNIISNNYISENGGGIYLGAANYNQINNNELIDNENGVLIGESIGNSVYHNIFIGNNLTAMDDGYNNWDNGYPSGGNYWDDYYGNDADDDGIGDTPYNISGGTNQDLYPLGIFNQPPIADFNYTPILPNQGETVQFNATAIDYDGTIVNYTWYFGYHIIYGKNPTYQFNDSGIYLISLEVKDDNGGTDTVAKMIPVSFDMMHITNTSVGWNFISTPYNQQLDSYEFIYKYDGYYYDWALATMDYNPTNFPLINSYMFGWNRTQQTYVFDSNLDPGYGCWMYAYQPLEIWIQEDTAPVDENITDLEAGWNIVGVPYDQPVNKTDILVNDIPWADAVTAGIVNDVVFGWDRGTQGYNFADTLMPGYAYWMYAYQPCTLKRVV